MASGWSRQRCIFGCSIQSRELKVIPGGQSVEQVRNNRAILNPASRESCGAS